MNIFNPAINLGQSFQKFKAMSNIDLNLSYLRRELIRQEQALKEAERNVTRNKWTPMQWDADRKKKQLENDIEMTKNKIRNLERIV